MSTDNFFYPFFFWNFTKGPLGTFSNGGLSRGSFKGNGEVGTKRDKVSVGELEVLPSVVDVIGDKLEDLTSVSDSD